ncbi:MAG: hypothetical protein AAGF07_01540 [Patescibacteria group bacterium]
MNKSSNSNLVNIVIDLLKEIQLVCNLSKGLSQTDKNKLKEVFFVNNLNSKSNVVDVVNQIINQL